MGEQPRTVARQCADLAKELEELARQLRDEPERNVLHLVEEKLWHWAEKRNAEQCGQLAQRVAEKSQRLREDAQHWLEEQRRALAINQRIREQITSRKGR